MKILLKKDIAKLGMIGETKNVASGYARNFLFPRGLAVPADAGNLAAMQNEMASINARKTAEERSIQDFADQLGKASVTLTVEVGETGKMFGSVTKDDLAEAITRDAGIEVDKHDIVSDEPIRETGVFSVDVRVKSSKFPEYIARTAKVKVWVMAKDQPKPAAEKPKE